MLDGFGTVVNALGNHVKLYLTQIVSTSGWTTRVPKSVNEQLILLCLAVVVKQSDEGQLLSKLGLVLFEQPGEEYPDMLVSSIAVEGAIANMVGIA